MLENGHMGSAALGGGAHPALLPPQVRHLLEGATPPSTSSATLTTADDASSVAAEADTTEAEVDATPSSSSSSSIGGSTVASLIAALRSPTTPSREPKGGDSPLNLDDDSASVNFDDSVFSDGTPLPLPTDADFDSLPLPIPLDIDDDASASSDVAKESDCSSSSTSTEFDLSDRSSTESTSSDASCNSESLSSDTSTALEQQQQQYSTNTALNHYGDETSSDIESSAEEAAVSDSAFDAFQSASSLAEAFSGTSSHFHTQDSAEFQPTSTSLGSYDHMTLMCSDFTSRS